MYEFTFVNYKSMLKAALISGYRFDEGGFNALLQSMEKNPPALARAGET